MGRTQGWVGLALAPCTRCTAHAVCSASSKPPIPVCSSGAIRPSNTTGHMSRVHAGGTACLCIYAHKEGWVELVTSEGVRHNQAYPRGTPEALDATAQVCSQGHLTDQPGAASLQQTWQDTGQPNMYGREGRSGCMHAMRRSHQRTYTAAKTLSTGMHEHNEWQMTEA